MKRNRRDPKISGNIFVRALVVGSVGVFLLSGCDQAELENAQRQIKKLETKERKLDRKLDTSQKLGQQMKAQLQRREAEATETDAKLSEASKAAAKLKSQLSQKTDAANELQKRLDLTRDQLQAKQNELAKMEEKVTTSKDQKNQYRSKYMILKGRFNKLKKKLSKAEASYSDERLKSVDLAVDKKQLKTELKEAKAKLSSYEDDLQAAVDEKIALLNAEAEAECAAAITQSAEDFGETIAALESVIDGAENNCEVAAGTASDVEENTEGLWEEDDSNTMAVTSDDEQLSIELNGDEMLQDPFEGSASNADGEGIENGFSAFSELVETSAGEESEGQSDAADENEAEGLLDAASDVETHVGEDEVISHADSDSDVITEEESEVEAEAQTEVEIDVETETDLEAEVEDTAESEKATEVAVDGSDTDTNTDEVSTGTAGESKFGWLSDLEESDDDSGGDSDE